MGEGRVREVEVEAGRVGKVELKVVTVEETE